MWITHTSTVGCKHWELGSLLHFLLYVCNEAAENELIRVTRVGERNFTPKPKPNLKLAYRLLLEAATQYFRFFAISVIFFKRVAYVAIVGNKTEAKMTINSEKMERKLIHNNLLVGARALRTL
jgi:hypothetical protein